MKIMHFVLVFVLKHFPQRKLSFWKSIQCYVPLLAACLRIDVMQSVAFDCKHWGPVEVYFSMGDFILKSISSKQKGVGFVTVPASRRAVQHEGEKHQESSDTHPQDQPEPRASREKSNQLPLFFFALVKKPLTHTHAHKQTVSLLSDAIS